MCLSNNVVLSLALTARLNPRHPYYLRFRLTLSSTMFVHVDQSNADNTVPVLSDVDSKGSIVIEWFEINHLKTDPSKSLFYYLQKKKYGNDKRY